MIAIVVGLASLCIVFQGALNAVTKSPGKAESSTGAALFYLSLALLSLVFWVASYALVFYAGMLAGGGQ